MNPAAKIVVWSAVLVAILLLTFKVGGKSALQSVLLLKDLVSHFLGPVAPYTYLIIVAIAAVVIWHSKKSA
jgi:hypothetical protein